MFGLSDARCFGAITTWSQTHRVSFRPETWFEMLGKARQEIALRGRDDAREWANQKRRERYAAKNGPSNYGKLTKQILELIAVGNSQNAIARMLDTSRSYVSQVVLRDRRKRCKDENASIPVQGQRDIAEAAEYIEPDEFIEYPPNAVAEYIEASVWRDELNELQLRKIFRMHQDFAAEVSPAPDPEDLYCDRITDDFSTWQDWFLSIDPCQAYDLHSELEDARERHFFKYEYIRNYEEQDRLFRLIDRYFPATQPKATAAAA